MKRKNLKINHARRGFALIELPLVLLILALSGLVVVAVICYIRGPVSWYWWPVAFIAPPAVLLALGLFVSPRDV